jgi:hypothetical protein
MFMFRQPVQQKYKGPINIPKNPVSIAWLIIKLLIWGAVVLVTGLIIKTIFGS